MIIEEDVRKKFAGLNLAVAIVNNVQIKKTDNETQNVLNDFCEQIRFDINVDELKNDEIIKAYRNFFWSIKIDPTKMRPAAEALIRRIVNGKNIPFINNVVDAYNKVSVETKITLGVYDKGVITGELTVRFAKQGEKFLGIGMDAPIELTGNELVLADKEKIISIYPYRDSNVTKVSDKTKNLIIVAYGVPGISLADLEKAVKKVEQEIRKCTDCELSEIEVVE
ncbi:MAG: hypothetical protein JXA43_03315 [Candidatus Diapherotrites archaeon]|nr:hypothetical protein [Candidatus Diapherotrites archaeon]